MKVKIYSTEMSHKVRFFVGQQSFALDEFYSSRKTALRAAKRLLKKLNVTDYTIE